MSRFFNKLASENALVRAQFGPTVEGDVGCSGGTPSFLGSYGNQRALELCDTSGDGEHHAPSQRRRRPKVPQQIEVRRFSPRSSLRCAHTQVAERHAAGFTALAYVSRPFLSHARSVCRVLHVTESGGAPVTYAIEELAEAVLPLSRDELRRRRAERAERRERASAGALRAVPDVGRGRAANLRSFSPRQLAWDRLLDLRRLVDLRYHGDAVPEGWRMLSLFWQLNFLLLSGATHARGMWHEAAAVAQRIDPDWGYASSELGTLYRKALQFEAGERVEFAGRLYPALYTPRNAKLISIFEITGDEQRELATIVSREEARRRDAERKRAERAAARVLRDREREGHLRRIVRLREVEGLSWARIVLQVPVSAQKAADMYRAYERMPKNPSVLGVIARFVRRITLRARNTSIPTSTHRLCDSVSRCPAYSELFGGLAG